MAECAVSVLEKQMLGARIRDEADALYARSDEEYRALRFKPHRTDFAAAIYALPRTTLFRHFGLDAGAFDIDLRPMLRTLFPSLANN